MEGTPFGRYRLVELLGRGGMGEVWRAFDTTFERVVALKVLPAHLSDDSVFQARFRREARVAAGLDEPHVVPIHDFGEIDGRLYVTMRLIQGRDLQAVIGGGPLSPARAVGIVEQVAEALHAAHEVGLVHRDVKPSNILIADNDFAYLIDFGIARAAADTSLTGTGSAIGTWAYMAPERFTTGGVDARSDVYALACVLYQSLTGLLPYQGDSLEQQMAGHLFAPVPQPSILRHTLPTQLDRVIASGMAKDPQHRYRTAKELATAARAALTNRTTAPPQRPTAAPTVTPPPGPPQATAGPDGDAWAAAATGVRSEADSSQSAGQPVGSSAVGGGPRRETENELRVAQIPSRQIKAGVGWAVPVLAVGLIAALGLAGWAVLRPTPAQAPPGTTPSSMSSNAPAPPEANYTDAQRADAKTNICKAYANVTKGINETTNSSPPSGSGDTGALAVAANARLALIGGGQYLLTRLDPATPPDLADAIRRFGNTVMEVGVNATLGLQNSDPGQAALLKDADQTDDVIKGLCK